MYTTGRLDLKAQRGGGPGNRPSHTRLAAECGYIKTAKIDGIDPTFDACPKSSENPMLNMFIPGSLL